MLLRNLEVGVKRMCIHVNLVFLLKSKACHNTEIKLNLNIKTDAYKLTKMHFIFSYRSINSR